VIFDIDVQGGLNLKHQLRTVLWPVCHASFHKKYRERLLLRQTDSPESISLRVEKAEKEYRPLNCLIVLLLMKNLIRPALRPRKCTEFLKSK